MQIFQKVVIGTCSASFLMVMIGFITPGWLIIDVDFQKMQEWEMKSLPIEEQNQLKEEKARMEKNPNEPHMKDLRLRYGPFYVRPCVTVEIGKLTSDICVIMLSGSAIDTMETMMRINETGQQVMQITEEDLHKNGINLSIESMINMCRAIVVVCSLAFIQSFVSLVLTFVYCCKRYPPKRLGVVGSVFLILSGTTTSIFLIIYLIIHGQYMSLIRSKHLEDVYDLGFPYSPTLCMFGSIMYFVCAGILIYLTLKSKGQYSYELMVIDTSKGGSTYIGKT